MKHEKEKWILLIELEPEMRERFWRTYTLIALPALLALIAVLLIWGRP